MAKSIAKLTEGEKYTFKFHGSRRLGNSPYEDDLYFQGVTGEGEDRRATLSETVDGKDSFEIYIFNKRWSYGTSAERISVLS